MVIILHYLKIMPLYHKICHLHGTTRSRGTISASVILTLLLLVFSTFGIIYYVLFGSYANQLAAYDDKSTENKKDAVPGRYVIRDILLPSPASDDIEDTFGDSAASSSSAAVNPPEEMLKKKEESAPNGEPFDDGWLKTAANHDLERDKYHEGDDASNGVEEPNAHSDNLYVRVSVGRVRSDASETGAITTRLFKGERIKVLAKEGDWLQINTEDGDEGWAHRMLFSKTAPTDPVEDNLSCINGIRIANLTEKGGDVFVELSTYSLPRTMMLKGERPRLVCDFYGFTPGLNLVKHIAIKKGPLRAIRLGYHSGKPSKTRVVIDLLPEYKYIVDKKFIVENNTYCIHIRLKE